MADLKVMDFKDTEYYKQYVAMIDEYGVKIVRSIVESQGIDTEEKFTRGDVLRETLKFVNGELRDFKDLDVVNPSRTEIEEEKIKDATERQAKAYLGI